MVSFLVTSYPPSHTVLRAQHEHTTNEVSGAEPRIRSDGGAAFWANRRRSATRHAPAAVAAAMPQSGGAAQRRGDIASLVYVAEVEQGAA